MESRLDTARRRAGTAKRALTGAAMVGFVAALLLARASHPGHAASPSSSGSGSTAGGTSSSVISPLGSNDGYGGSGYGYSRLPQVQTHVS